MDLLFWRKNKTIDAFANTLANELFSTIQPQMAKEYFEQSKNDKQAKKELKKFDTKLAELFKQIKEFEVTYSLGVYGKARFHLKFTERLKELGYDPAIASKLDELSLLKGL